MEQTKGNGSQTAESEYRFAERSPQGCNLAKTLNHFQNRSAGSALRMALKDRRAEATDIAHAIESTPIKRGIVISAGNDVIRRITT
jgi:hypothetical protein